MLGFYKVCLVFLGVEAMSASVSQNCVSSFAVTEELVRSYPEMVTRFEGQLFGFALMLTSDMAYAESVLCESFIKVFEEINAGRISSEREVLKVLYQTTTDLVSAYGPRNINPKINEISAEASAIRSFLCGKVRKYNLIKAIEQLPQRSKLVFVLKDIHGFTRADVAEILEISLNDVKTLLHRARMMVRTNVRRYIA